MMFLMAMPLGSLFIPPHDKPFFFQLREEDEVSYLGTENTHNFENVVWNPKFALDFKNTWNAEWVLSKKSHSCILGLVL